MTTSTNGPPEPGSTSPRRLGVILGVGGGIAAYKVCEVLRGLTESGHDVRVVATESALHFVGAATWEALSGHPVHTGVFDDPHDVPHVHLGREADLVVVAPATANLLARAAHGIADDLLTNTLLTARCPIVFVPAMHTEMWEHPATADNVATLRRRGALVMEPEVGRLTGVDTGKGRLPEPVQILEQIRVVLRRGVDGLEPDLTGRHVVISAGGTREYLDPVRFLGNRSSGRQGFALASTALARGARVTVVAANVSQLPPAGVDVVRVDTTAELREQMLSAALDADAVVMAAAPADFRPVQHSDVKIKRAADGSAPSIELTQNPDILAELVAGRSGKEPIIVGFAAETGDAAGTVVEHGREKLARKGCDFLVVNDVSAGKVFGQPMSEALILGSDGTTTSVPQGPKEDVADAVWDLVAQRLGA
jgi:phosphopantothenoylcysteine decarboxylase/phosphopantothenate--cysteine ligase